MLVWDFPKKLWLRGIPRYCPLPLNHDLLEQSSARLSYRCLDLFLFLTWAYFVCLIPVLCWPYMIWFLGLIDFFLSNWGDGHCRKWRWLYYPCLWLPNVKMAAPYVYAVSIIIIHEDTNYIQTGCQQCWTLPNCLPALLNMAQLFAIIAQLLATIVKHRPTVSSSAKDRSTVCQSFVTSIIRLNPSSFLGFLFSFQNSVFLCFLFFTGGQLGALQLRVLEI